MTSHLTSSEFELLARGQLGEQEEGEIRSHLEACAICREAFGKCEADERLAGELRDAVGVEGGENGGGDRVSAAGASGSDGRQFPTITGYRIVGKIHQGGQGAVFEAVQESTRRRVALKVMLGGPLAGRTARRRFEREVELAAGLHHPNIVTIHDSGAAQGNYYFAMDLVEDARRLDAYVAEQTLSVAQTLELFRKVCEAVNHAHQNGVIHRDLKPSNILVDRNGEPRVVDFGLARPVNAAEWSVLSLDGQVLGTLPYMSPEQAGGGSWKIGDQGGERAVGEQGDDGDLRKADGLHTAASGGSDRGRSSLVDVRTDVYSLGVILYEILTGGYPYPVVGHVADVLRHIAQTPPARPSQTWRSGSPGLSGTERPLPRLTRCPIDNDVETIVLKCLHKERDRRYQSAGELARDIAHWLSGEPIEAKRDSLVYVLRKKAGRHRYATGVLAALVLTIVGFGAVSFDFYMQARRALAQQAQSDNAAVRSQQELGQLGVGAELAVRRTALALFLSEWNANRPEQALKIRADVSPKSPEYAVMSFLLDETYPVEKLRAGVGPAGESLAHFAVGERALKAGNTAQAVRSFRQCAKTAGVDWGMRWLAEARLDRLASPGAPAAWNNEADGEEGEK